jgi:hypothetical protein
MATLQRYAPAGIVNPNEANIMTGYEAASQSFKAGDWVDSSSGKIALAVAAGNTLGANDDCWGIALEDATGTTNNPIRIYKFHPGFRIILPVYHGTAASAITAYADIGSSFGIRFHTGNIWCVALDETSATKGWITYIPNQRQMPIGTQYGLVEFEIDFAQTAGPGA